MWNQTSYVLWEWNCLPFEDESRNNDDKSRLFKLVSYGDIRICFGNRTKSAFAWWYDGQAGFNLKKQNRIHMGRLCTYSLHSNTRMYGKCFHLSKPKKRYKLQRKSQSHFDQCYPSLQKIIPKNKFLTMKPMLKEMLHSFCRGCSENPSWQSQPVLQESLNSRQDL